ncbi:MAG: IS1595 family transposase [Desulfovibrio sp.]|nr:IS1595 family transposase [Desulfovibrio sp.]
MPENEQLEILTQLFQNLSDKDKTAFLTKIACKSDNQSSPSNSNQSKSSFLRTHKDKIICPVCGSIHVVKNGTNCGTQRYLCRDCNKSFGETENSILKDTKKGLDVWRLYVKCMIEKKSIRKCARICDISIPTSFLWRHKILDALQNMMNEVKLNGVVEADETFTAISYKGNETKGRKPHKRGTKAEKPGLSEEKVCIPCGINMNGLSIARVSNLGKPSWKDIKTVLGGKVDKGSILVTDSFRDYHKLANEMEVTHIRIPRKKYTNGAFNIQLLNNYHCQLKEMINRDFNGVSTKYLNNYIVYHNMVNFSNGDEKYKEDVMFKFTMTTKCKRTRKEVYNRPLIPV